MSLINVQNLSCAVGKKILLENISFSLQAKEFLVIVGRNGAGKSTLLKHLTGEMTLKEGRIELFLKNLKDHKTRDLAKRRAVLPQSTQLSFSYKVLEVVLLGRIPHQSLQKESDEDYQIAKDCLKRVGLQNYEMRDYLTLSGGEQQRVHLARALAQLVPSVESSSLSDERLLFLDEPTSSLDIAHQHQVLDVVKNLSHQGVGVLAVLHDLNLAAQYADKVLVLSDGKILASGSPKDVLTASVLTDAFRYPVQVIDHPSENRPLVI